MNFGLVNHEQETNIMPRNCRLLDLKLENRNSTLRFGTLFKLGACSMLDNGKEGRKT